MDEISHDQPISDPFPVKGHTPTDVGFCVGGSHFTGDGPQKLRLGPKSQSIWQNGATPILSYVLSCISLQWPKKQYSKIFKWDEMLKFLSSNNHNRILTKAKSQGTPGVFARNPGPGISDLLRPRCQMRGAKEAPISNLAFLHLGDPNRLREMPRLLLRHDGRRSGVGHLLQLRCISCFPVHLTPKGGEDDGY